MLTVSNTNYSVYIYRYMWLVHIHIHYRVVQKIGTIFYALTSSNINRKFSGNFQKIYNPSCLCIGVL